MIPKIKKVLYATDLSKNSAYAFRYAVNTAEKHDASIAIVYVLEQPRLIGAWPGDVSKLYEDAKPAQMEKMKARLDVITEKEFKDKPEMRKRIAEVAILEGDPSDVILQKADDMEADVLIMGTHSKGIIANAFLGSVASKVLQRIRIPVLIIPIPKKTDIAFED